MSLYRQGGESGKVHNTVKERWLNKDPELVNGMLALGDYAYQAKVALESSNVEKLVELIDLNFTMRRRLYGDEVVGLRNIALAELAKEFGLAAKFTGSGGAFVMIRRDCTGLGQW